MTSNPNSSIQWWDECAVHMYVIVFIRTCIWLPVRLWNTSILRTQIMIIRICVDWINQWMKHQLHIHDLWSTLQTSQSPSVIHNLKTQWRARPWSLKQKKHLINWNPTSATHLHLYNLILVRTATGEAGHISAMCVGMFSNHHGRQMNTE